MSGPGGPGQGPGGIGGGTGTPGAPGSGSVGGGRSNVNQSTVLPIFDEDNLPSARQHGVLIAIRLSNGNMALGISTGLDWTILT